MALTFQEFHFKLQDCTRKARISSPLVSICLSLSISPSPTQSSLKCLIHTDTIGLPLEKTAVSSASVATADHLSGHTTLRQIQFFRTHVAQSLYAEFWGWEFQCELTAANHKNSRI